MREPGGAIALDERLKNWLNLLKIGEFGGD
jgi:hypothetical protein